MSVKIYFSKHLKLSPQDQDIVSKRLLKASQNSSRFLKLSNTLSVYIYSNSYLDSGFVSGYTPSPYFVQLAFNENRNLDETLLESFELTFTHELHHTVRLQDLQVGENLFDVLCFEGLAKQFEQEALGIEDQRYVFSQTETERLLDLAKADFFNPEYSYRDWFFGNTQREIPKRAGYVVGSEIIKRFKEATSLTPSQAVSINSNEIYEQIKLGL